MQEQPRNVFHLLGWPIFAVWAFAAFIRMAGWMPTLARVAVWVVVGSLVFSGMAWGLVRKVRTGKVPAKEEEQAVIKWVLAFFSIITTGLGVGFVASLIAVVELNDSFSRQAVDR